MTDSTGDPGPILELEIGDVAHGGVFVARHEGRVVFVPDVLPGERVLARVTDASKSSFWRAEAIEVRDASPHRRPHVWREADIAVAPENRPGGADFGHIALEHQRELKLTVLRDALKRFGGMPDPDVSIAPAGSGSDAERADGTGWRTRVSLHVDDDGRIGPYAARSHHVIAVESLPLAGGLIGTGGELSWPRPTRPGDVLRLEIEIVQIMPSRSRPDRGVALTRIITRNQRDEDVQILVAKLVVPRRP